MHVRKSRFNKKEKQNLAINSGMCVRINSKGRRYPDRATGLDRREFESSDGRVPWRGKEANWRGTRKRFGARWGCSWVRTDRPFDLGFRNSLLYLLLRPVTDNRWFDDFESKTTEKKLQNFQRNLGLDRLIKFVRFREFDALGTDA